MSSLHRRGFCRAIGSFAATSCYVGMPRAGAAEARQGVWERTWQAFGTSVRLQIRGVSASRATAACSAAMRETQRIEQLMSIYQPDSQVSRLNRDGQLETPHPYLVEVLHQAQRFHRETGRAFDVTVQPLWQLYRDASQQQRLPEPRQLQQVRQRVGHHQLAISSHRIELKPGAQITLNGIAQGFATDRIQQILLDEGIKDALIDVGELAGMGVNDHGAGWQVGIQHPREPHAFVAVTPLESRCLATSGDYATAFTEDFRAHHIFDPRTGASPTELASVSVLAPTATAADAIATALLVQGVAKGVRYLQGKRQVDAMFVRKDARVLTTPGFPQRSLG